MLHAGMAGTGRQGHGVGAIRYVYKGNAGVQVWHKAGSMAQCKKGGGRQARGRQARWWQGHEVQGAGREESQW